MRKFHIHRKVQGEFYGMGFLDRKTTLNHQTFIYKRRKYSSSTGVKGIIYEPLMLGGAKIGFRAVTQIL
jgi:hypothetical protein